MAPGWRIGSSRGKFSIVISLIAAVFLVSLIFPSAQAQERVNFTGPDRFSIPANNCTISFGGNGSYETATLKSSFWVFTDLRLNGSVPLATLKLSAENSNVTVTSYRTRNGTLPSETLSYRIEGEGKLMVNLGLSEKGIWNGGDWSVTKRQTNSTLFPAQGHDWNMGNDGTITVYKLTGNLTITHYFFSGVLDTNLPFYLQHSVAISVAIAVVLTVIIATVIVWRNKLSELIHMPKNGGAA